MAIEPESATAEAMVAGERETVANSSATAPKWSAAKRVAFRFCFIYFILYGLSNQILGGLVMIPKVDIPDPGTLWPLRPMTFWVAKHVFRVTRELVYTGSGSGDKTFDWVMTFSLLVIAVIGTLVWSVLDRRRENYAKMYKWFRVFVRFMLASEMFLYGFDKLIPLQMPFPFLTKLLEPYGNFSPMAVLWYSIGASTAYEIFAGCAEVLGGVLLLAPRTATLGALVCLADLIQVFMLNMTYDVPVKLFSFHLILLAVFLLAPDLGRLADFFLRARPAAASAEPKLFRTARSNRIAVAAQIVFGVYLIGMNLYQAKDAWHEYGGGRQKSALYGIWEVQQMSIDGKERPALLDDKDRWRRLVFDFVKGVSLEHMDETFAGYGAAIDEKAKSLELTSPKDKKWKATFTFERPAADELVLNGAMDGHQIHAQLKLFDRNQFTLVNRGFHWINEYPFQR
ncbi:MAG TPA: hypothetical protein VMH00_01155 [Candidatus Limnocylindrales bacterium]|nr:hypothetical protein [Candidatus Limnocylindrales bacterium]